MDFRITVTPDRSRTKLVVRTQNHNNNELATTLARMVEDAVAQFARQYSA